MRLHQLTFFGFAAFAFGCAGGQTGDLSGEKDDNGGETAGGNCEQHKQKLGGFDEETDLGTPEQVLTFAEQTFDAPLSWKERAGQTWHVGPETGTSSIQLTVTRGESAYYVTYTQKPNDSGIEIGSFCPPPQLGVDVHVDVSTEGGALAESFDTLLLSSSSELATLSIPLDLDKLSGTLAVDYSDPRVELVQVGLNVTLMAEGMTGSLGGIEQTNLGDAVSAGAGGVIAVWPDSPACASQYGDSSGIGVAPSQNALGITGDAAGTLASETTPADITWLDGSSAQLTLEVTVEGDGCLKVGTYGGLDDGQNGSVTYPARFKLTSDDGRVDGEYTGTLVTWPSGSASGVNAEANLVLAVAQAAESGFASVEVPSSVERLGIALQVTIEDGITMGSLLLNGFTDPPCLTMPAEPMETPGGGMSAPGCEGTHVTPLESASWGP